jgi:predicted DNA-binding protein with PD1-like motif/glutaredoxin
MRALPLHFDAGSDLHLSLEAYAAEQGLHGFVISVVGNLRQAAFQCPGQAQPTVLQGDLEVITLQGTLAPDGVHLHLSLSDGQCQVWGGHLEPGTLVQKGVDLLVGVLESSAPAPQISTDPASVPAPPPASGERVQMVVRAGCPWCRRALRLLQGLGIPYQAVEATSSGPVPQVWVDGGWIGGYDALVDLQVRGQLQGLGPSR